MQLTKWRRVVLALVAGALTSVGVAGCAPEFTDSSCQSADDCFPGEACIDGTCRATGGGGADAGADGGAEAGPGEGEPAVLVVTPESVTVGVNREVGLVVSVLDGAGNRLEETEVSWSTSDESVAVVSTGGGDGGDGRHPTQRARVVGKGTGETTITATVGDLTTDVTVTVTKAQVVSVEVTPAFKRMPAGGSQSFTAVALDADGNPLSGRKANWSVENTTIARVNADGRVTAKQPGETEVRAEIEGKEGKARIVVERSPVSDVEIRPSSPPALFVGNSLRLRAVPIGSDGNPICTDTQEQKNACGYDQQWASAAPNIASVTSSGRVEGVAVGTTKIFAVVGSSLASVTIEVEEKPANEPPLADAGQDKLGVPVNQQVQLDGSGSQDPEGNQLMFQWSIKSQPSGANASLSDPSVAKPTFTPTVAGTYVFELVVSDGAAQSMPDTVKVIAGNVAPKANVSASASDVNVGDSVTFDASGSSDPDGMASNLSYSWAITSSPSGSTASLNSSSGKTTKLTPDEPGTYEVEVTVDDGAANNASATATASVTANGPPEPDAGMDRQVTVGTQVSLTSQSTDPDGDSLSYQWSFVSKPNASMASLTNASSKTTSFTADAAGAFEVKLTVDDGMATRSDTVTVGASAAQSPTADAGSDKSGVNIGTTVSLDGSGSSDPQGQTLTYAWSFKNKPGNSTATISNASSATASFTPDVTGTYDVELKVTDPDGNTDTDVVTIDAVDQAPTADAGSDRSGVQIGSTVTLDGSNSSDPQGQTLSYQWSFASKPGASTTTITDATKATASFKPDVEGTYELSLQVTDPDGNSDTDKVTVGVVGPTPTADAGSKKTGVKVGETVSLDGSGSSDPQGQTLTYAWSFKSRPSGSTATITDASKVSASFQPDEPGTYKIKLTVTDPDGNTDSDKVTVKVVNQKPTADIAVSSADSAHGEYKKGTSVTLDGTGSSDPEGNSLTYSWTFANKPGSSTATIQSASSATASFTPDVVGTFEVKLVVKDQAGKKGSAKQTVPAVDDLKPTASIALTGGTSAHGEYKTGASITLDGTSSSDPEGGSLTYSWAFASKPNGSTSTIQSASSDTASLTPDVAGTYDIDLTVTDSAGNTHTASASVVAVDDLTPVADVAGSTSRTVTLQGGTATISLDGSASSDEEDMNSALTFAWDKKSGPGSVTYSAASSASTDATVSVAGTYELRLTVTDTSGNTDTVVVTVQVN